METVMAIAPIGSAIWEQFKPYWDMNKSRGDLRKLLEDLRTLSSDMDGNIRGQENNPRRRRGREVIVYLRTVNDFIQEATQDLDESEESMIKRAQYVGSIRKHLTNAAEHLSKGENLLIRGLTYTMDRMRGDILPVRKLELMGETACRTLNSTLEAIDTRQKYKIGIYGCPGAGKKSLMKHIYNKVLRDYSDFKGVFWAEAPEIPGNDFTLQEKVSEGMWFDFENDGNCVRRASMLDNRLKQMAASGRVILFLCNLKQEFHAYEVLGISDKHCVFVFTAPSLDVCNRMKCDMIIKVDHLPVKEAEELFMREAGLTSVDRILSSQEEEIKDVATQIATECARMPLAIRVIANSMREINNIHEWRNRHSELMGRITAINNEEDKILEQLKFAFICLKDPTIRKCFEVAAQVLANDAVVSKENIIKVWRSRKLIGRDGYNDEGHTMLNQLNGIDDSDEYTDQGHTMLNQLQRLCLLEVEPSHDSHQFVTMNKWIRKIATEYA